MTNIRVLNKAKLIGRFIVGYNICYTSSAVSATIRTKIELGTSALCDWLTELRK